MKFKLRKAALVTIIALYSSLTWAPYLNFRNGKSYEIPEGWNTEEAACLVYMYFPEAFDGHPPSGCESFVVKIMERQKTRSQSAKYLPLPNGEWYEISGSKQFVQAWCEAYIERPEAFESIRKKMANYGCNIPTTLSLKNAILDAGEKVDSAWNSAKGLTDGDACIKKYGQDVRLIDAVVVLENACRNGYQRDALAGLPNSSEWVKASRCIASSANKFFSFDSTLSAVNECTQSMSAGAKIFGYYKGQLYSKKEEDRRAQEANAKIQRMQEQRRRDLLRPPLTCLRLGDDMMTCD